MSVLEVLKYPDVRLREVSTPVVDFDISLKQFAQNMLETMSSSRGIGLAAPQVGRLIRLIVVDTRRDNSLLSPSESKGNPGTSGNPQGDGVSFSNEYVVQEDNQNESDFMTELEKNLTQPLILVNPQIVSKKGKTTFDEGCLSVPTYFETVQRAKEIKVKFHDLDGMQKHLEVDGLMAIVIQHEIDHLDGILFIDHLSLLKSNKIKKQIKKYGYSEKGEDPAKSSVRNENEAKILARDRSQRKKKENGVL